MNMVSLDKCKRNKDKGNFFTRSKKRFFHVTDALKYSIVEEQNMILILFSSILCIVAGFVFSISSYEWIICIMCIGLVCASEMFNTAIEAVVDKASPEIHPLARIAKDSACTATFILSIMSFVVALIIFIPKLVRFF